MGGDGYYGGARETRSIDNKTYYAWPDTWALVRKLQPHAVIFSDAGPDIRWVGNERGYAPATCWAPIKPEGMYPGHADRNLLAHGSPEGTVWRPAEVDVSIRKGWFFHPDESPKSVDHLLDIYYRSVGHGACLLLNLTPDRRGLIPEQDIERLQAFSAVLDRTFEVDLARAKKASASNERGGAGPFGAANVTDGDRSSYWATDDGVRDARVTIDLGEDTLIDRVRLQEYIPLGQRIAAFSLEVHRGDGWEEIARGTTIGARRILCFPAVKTDRIRLAIESSLACPTLSTFEVYASPGEKRNP
jgi:alpha-L-fucosidase